jgi:biopolymer transport protein ExbD
MPKLDVTLNTLSRVGARRARATRVSSSLSEINVVPLVDVMLVLLVIFMVAAPLMQQGFPVKLPQSRQTRAIDQTPVTVTIPISFRKDRRVRLGSEAVRLDVLAERVRQALANETGKKVVLAGDADVTYQELITVMERLKEGGVVDVGLQTEPPARERARQ